MYIPRTIVEASRLMPTDRSDKNDKRKKKQTNVLVIIPARENQPSDGSAIRLMPAYPFKSIIT